MNARGTTTSVFEGMKPLTHILPKSVRHGLWRRLYRTRDRWFSPIVGCQTVEKVIALTFDDGPNPMFTPGVLEMLDRYGVKATFFVIGQHVETHPELVQQVVQAGHALGNHTFSHQRLAGIGVKRVADELQRCAQAVQAAATVKTTLMRPPFGEYDVSSFMAVSMLGYSLVNWSAVGSDWLGDEATVVADRVVGSAHPGCIALLHDGCGPAHPVAGMQGISADRQPTVQALPIIVERLRDEGYRFVTVPQMLREAPSLRKPWL
jgi:peptidoglycan-N-acetylglucosamine deacetylase